MARIRKSDERRIQQIIWKVGKYIRLSREDGNVVSESVVNQDKILNDEIPGFFEDGLYEVVDTYIDDGTSGTSDIERGDFQRMVQDMKTGRINCIVVKNLSRAFRNSANQGHFLEEFIPLYNTRFISLYQPRIDTFLDPEIVHSLEVSITGFMNEQYAYKTSADVRRTFKHKRENGEFIGAFAPYGYAKDREDKNALVIDEDAAQVVRDMFSWFLSGTSKAGIARRLNELGIPNPTAYKRSKGFRYENPHAKENDGLWNPTTVTRMLQDSLYIGVMRQGKQKVISYKVHKRACLKTSGSWWRTLSRPSSARRPSRRPRSCTRRTPEPPLAKVRSTPSRASSAVPTVAREWGGTPPRAMCTTLAGPSGISPRRCVPSILSALTYWNRPYLSPFRSKSSLWLPSRRWSRKSTTPP